MSSQKTSNSHENHNNNHNHNHDHNNKSQESIHQFRQAVSYVFNSWTALKLAVEMQWGGIDSSDKCEWFMNVVMDHFMKSK